MFVMSCINDWISSNCVKPAKALFQMGTACKNKDHLVQEIFERYLSTSKIFSDVTKIKMSQYYSYYLIENSFHHANPNEFLIDEQQLEEAASRLDQTVKNVFIEASGLLGGLWAADMKRELNLSPECMTLLDFPHPIEYDYAALNSPDPEINALKIYQLFIDKFPTSCMKWVEGETQRLFKKLDGTKWYDSKTDTLWEPEPISQLIDKKVQAIFQAVDEANKLSQEKEKQEAFDPSLRTSHKVCGSVLASIRRVVS